MLMITIPTAKFMFVCQWGGALKRQKIKSLYITRKRKKSQHSSTNRLYIHTQVVVSLTLCQIIVIFFSPEVIGAQKGDLRYNSQRFGRWPTVI